MAKKKKKIAWGQVGLHIYFIITSLLYIVPMLLILSISFTGSNFKNFSLFPEEFSNCAILSLNKLEYDTVTYTVTSKNSSGIQATLNEILSLSQDTLANVVLQDGTYNISEPIVINNNDSDKKKSNRYKEC